MENTPKKVAKPELQLIISILVATSLILAELYVIINQPANIVLLAGVAVLVLIAVYFVIDAVVDCEKEKEIAIKEQYDNIYRSEKASYMLLKKKMEEFAEVVQSINQNDQTDDLEEMMNAQRTLAKLVVSKNRESVEMLAEKIAKLENDLDSVKISGIDEEKQDRLFIELNNLEASLNDRLQGLSDKLSGFQEEIERLADHIARINSEAIQTALNTNTAPIQKTELVAEKEIVLLEDIPAMEVTDDIEFTELNMDGITIVHEDEVFGMSAFAEEDFPEEDTSSEEEDLAALLGDVLDEDIDVLAELTKAVDELEEPIKVIEPAPVEEKKPTPPPAPADNGGKMNQDDIAALIASMTGN